MTMTSALKTGLLVSTLLTTTAFADDPENILITGVRTPIAMNEMATAVSVLDRELLDLRQSFQLIDILQDVPGLTVARSGSVGGQVQVRMRGTEGNHVLVLIDGVEANDPASADEFLFEHLSAMEIERVEIIRGPQSALWGSDAVAGVINIVTRGAGDGFEGGGSFEAGSQNSYRASGRAAWGAESWSLNAGASYSESEGTNVSRFGDEDDGHSLVTGQARLVVRPADDLRLNVTLRYVEAETETDAFDPPIDSDQESEVSRLMFAADLQSDRGLWTHKTGASWFDSGNEFFVASALDRTLDAERWKVFHQSTFEVRERHKVTLAVDHRETRFVQTGEVQPWGDPNQTQEITNTGYVLDYAGAVTDAITVTASVRQDVNSDFDDVATWRMGGSWNVTGETRLRASYGRGHKAPTFSDRFGSTPDTYLGNPNLVPEVSDSFEVGVERSFWDGRANLGLTYFNARLEDEIKSFHFDFDSGLFTTINKDGESERQGIEVTLDAQLTDHLSLSSNYTWTDSSEPDDLGGMQQEVRRPEHAGSISLSYAADNGVNVNLNATLVGEALDTDFSVWPFIPVELPEYGLINLAFSAPLNERAEAYGRIEKPTNDDYETVFGYATPDVQFAVGLRLIF